MEEKNKKIIPENDTLKAGAEAAEALADLANDAMKFGKSSEDITKADQQSTSEYFTALTDTLNSINKEISECNDPEEKSRLYKQREDMMNRMREEKEKQRQNNNEREEKDRNQATGFFAIVTAVALGAGTIATTLLIGSKKS